MKYWYLSLLLTCLVACNRAEEPQVSAIEDPQRATDQAVVEAQKIVKKAMKGDKGEGVTEGLEGCKVLDSGLVSEIFEVDASIITFERSIPDRRTGHVLCRARWEKPDKKELNKAYRAAMMEWTKSKAEGERIEMPKYPQMESRVSLTLSADAFDSPDKAIASLESTVATLSGGVAYKVRGKEYETKMSFGDWIEGVGNKAIFSSNGELLVAYDTGRLAVSVSAMGDKAKDREKAIQLAQRIMTER